MSQNINYSVTGNLTQEHIDLGIKSNSTMCAVALFLTDLIERPVRIFTACACEAEDDKELIANFGPKLRAFVREFDRNPKLCSPEIIGELTDSKNERLMEIIN